MRKLNAELPQSNTISKEISRRSPGLQQQYIRRRSVSLPKSTYTEAPKVLFIDQYATSSTNLVRSYWNKISNHEKGSETFAGWRFNQVSMNKSNYINEFSEGRSKRQRFKDKDDEMLDLKKLTLKEPKSTKMTSKLINNFVVKNSNSSNKQEFHLRRKLETHKNKKKKHDKALTIFNSVIGVRISKV